jgi:N-acetyl-anhydromuramyl-L-alanine amidase AmpD
MAYTRRDVLIPLEPGQAVSKGWTQATGGKAMGITWHWTACSTLAVCREVLGGAHAERKGNASAHYGIGRTFAEGIDRYVSIENRSWHAGINQTLSWDGKATNGVADRKGTRTTIGVETVSVGNGDVNSPSHADWIRAAKPDGSVTAVQPWTEDQLTMIVEVGKEIVARFPNITVRNHHGHHDLCPDYKTDVVGFPFARVLRDIYNDPSVPDVWTPLWMPAQRQRVLIALGYDLGPAGADGHWGAKSQAALRQFQTDNGMLVDERWTTFVCWKAYDVLTAKGLVLADVAGAA